VLRQSVRRPSRRAPPDRAAAILDAARKIAFTDGASGISARKIAARAGCSATTLYLYYRNLDDLLHHLRMEGHALLATAFGRVDARRPALARVRAMGRAYYRFGLANRSYYQLMFVARASVTPSRELVQREMYTLMLLRDVIQSGLDRGEFRREVDPMVATNALWAEIHGVTALALSGMLVETSAGHHEEVLEAVLDGAARWLAAAGDSNGQRY
jgi:AcrR family transcriptional regulator